MLLENDFFLKGSIVLQMGESFIYTCTINAVIEKQNEGEPFIWI